MNVYEENLKKRPLGKDHKSVRNATVKNSIRLTSQVKVQIDTNVT